MKKHIFIILALQLMLLVGCSSNDGKAGKSTLYKQYASQPALTVAELSNFKLNDSITVNVVMVQADSDESWQKLKDSLDIRGTEGSVSWLGNIDNPAIRTTWNGEPVTRVVASHPRHTVGFYRIDNDEQYDALIDYQLNNI